MDFFSALDFPYQKLLSGFEFDIVAMGFERVHFLLLKLQNGPEFILECFHFFHLGRNDHLE